MIKEELVIIDTLEGCDRLIAYLNSIDLTVLDTETTGVFRGAEIIGYSVCAEEWLAFYVILAAWNRVDEKLDYLETMHATKEIMEILQKKDLVGHNFLFDADKVESNFKVKLMEALHTDTLILAHLLDENREVGLKELCADLFGDSSKDEQRAMKASVIANGGKWSDGRSGAKEMYKADPYILAKYGAKDALLNFRLFISLMEDLEKQGLTDFFFEESMPLLKGPTYELNTTGLTVDTNALAALKNTLIAECAEAKAFILKEIAPHIKDKYPGTKAANTFNIGASQQKAWLLFGQLNLEFNTLTKGGKLICQALDMKVPYTFVQKRNFIHAVLENEGKVYQPEAIVNGKKVKAKKVRSPWAYIQADQAALKKVASKYKFISKMIEHDKKQKILKTYVIGIGKLVEYGRVYPQYLQHGTLNGRYSCKNPNFQNLPRDDQRVKECIVARPGKCFVSADYSQLEPRVFAYYSGDPKLMSAFDGKTDFYSVIGMEVYDITDATPQKDGSPDAFGIKYKHLRDISKVIGLSTPYGTTAYKLASKTGKNVDSTQEDMDKYMERFPGVKTMMLDAHEIIKADGQIVNLFGRPRRIPEAKHIDRIFGRRPHAEYDYKERNLLNMACNSRIQGTGASIINRAAIAFYSAIRAAGIKDCQIVIQVHDELGAECRIEDKDTVYTLLRQAMETTTVLEGVPLEAIPRISQTLAK